MKALRLALLLPLLAAAVACDNDKDATPTEFTGPRVAVGDGYAWSYVRTDAAGEPQEIGVQLDDGALRNLPNTGHHAHEYVLPLPDGSTVPPYNHITLDWNAHGHPPMNVFDKPHFDLHFYFISMAERDLIGPHDSTQFNRPLPAEHLAPMYLETPGGVPRMGAHVIDLQSPEVAGTGTFTHTFIYGKYDGTLNFLEPMVTRAFLESKASADQPIRRPAQWQESGYYPE
ncbi:MAG: DUF5602 domain-containing protein, partial [Catalinimonas sp.]